MATIDIFNLSPRDFNLQMQEEAMYRTPAELDELRREYRNRNSMAGKLMGLLAPEEGKRRSTFLPVDAPQGMSIFDALRSGQATPAVPQGLVDLITGGTRGVESAREYAQGVPPRADALNDALAMAGLAMTGGGAVVKPKGSLGAFFAREDGTLQDALKLAKSGRGIFHSSQADQFDEINKYGVEPQYGPWTREIAEGATEDPRFLDEMPMAAWWSEQPDWVKMKTARTAGKSVNDVTVDDIRKYGHLSIADADEYADTVYRIPEEGIDYEGSQVSDLTGEKMPLYATDLYEFGDDNVGRYPFGIERNELVTRETIDPKYSLTGQDLIDFLRDYDTTAANASKSTGLLTSSAADLRRQANIERFGYDPNETPEVETSYRGGHQPAGPQDESPVRLDDVTISTTGEQAGYPSDFYSSQGQRLYAQGPRFADDEFGLSNQQSYRAIQAARGNPDAEVTIYRGVPNEESITSINAGDFVTLSPKYAELHASSGYGPRGEDAGKVISQKVKVKDVYFAGDDVNEFGYFPDTTAANASKSTGLLTTAASEAQDMAKRILELRAQGRASEVTDEMMAQADPQYMFENTPLPMDEASRMARAEAAGFEGDLFHGGKGGYDIMRTDAGTGKTSGTGAFLTPSNKLAETYSPVVDGSVYPLMSRSSAPIVNADMQNWNNIESPVYAFDPKTMDDIEVIDEYGRASTDDIAREARKISEAIEIQDVSDRGPRAWGMTQYPAVSNVRVEYNPANIRSRFARFDPEFAHLSNLSAANVSPLGGLLAQSGVSDKQAERIEEYLRRRGLLD